MDKHLKELNFEEKIKTSFTEDNKRMIMNEIHKVEQNRITKPHYFQNILTVVLTVGVLFLVLFMLIIMKELMKLPEILIKLKIILVKIKIMKAHLLSQTMIRNRRMRKKCWKLGGSLLFGTTRGFINTITKRKPILIMIFQTLITIYMRRTLRQQ